MPKYEDKSLTRTRIDAQKPRDKDYEVYDRSGVGGFAVRVYPSGKKDFVINYRINGKRARMTIGDAKVMGLEEARTEAGLIKQKAKGGIDPAKEKRDVVVALLEEQARDENTFTHTADLFIERYCIEDKKLKSWREYKRILHKYVLPHWGNRNIGAIKRNDVTALLDNVAKNYGPYQANRVLSTIRKLFNWACVRGTIEIAPIVVGMARSESPRDRYLSDEEILKFWDGCEKLKYPYGKMFQLLLLTGQRRGEVINMKWSQVDMSNKIWRLPAHSSKMNRPHLIPLSTMAIDLLEMMPKFPDSDLLFPTAMNRNRPVDGVSPAKKRVCEIKDWRLHDLRRTVRTNLAKLKVPYHTCNKVLGHIDQSVEKHYDEHDYVDEKREALEAWSKRLTSILAKNVVDLDTKRA